jgi:hypothetical protein
MYGTQPYRHRSRSTYERNGGYWIFGALGAAAAATFLSAQNREASAEESNEPQVLFERGQPAPVYRIVLVCFHFMRKKKKKCIVHAAYSARYLGTFVDSLLSVKRADSEGKRKRKTNSLIFLLFFDFVCSDWWTVCR